MIEIFAEVSCLKSVKPKTKVEFKFQNYLICVSYLSLISNIFGLWFLNDLNFQHQMCLSYTEYDLKRNQFYANCSKEFYVNKLKTPIRIFRIFVMS